MANYRIPSDYKNDVPRSVHHWRSPVCGTFHPGLAYPVKWYHLDVGDRLRGKPEFLVQSQPMLGPLLQGFKLVTIATFTPDSVLYGWRSSGIRYTPKELMAFPHYVFNPCRLDDQRDRTAPAAVAFTYESSFVTGVGQGFPVYALALGSSAASSMNDSPYVDGKFALDYRGHVGRGSLWDWLGVGAGSIPPKISANAPEKPGDPAPTEFILPQSFNWRTEPLVSYFLSVYYYLANMQEKPLYFTRGAYTDQFSFLPFSMVYCSGSADDVLKFLAQARVNSMQLSYNKELFYTLNYGGSESNMLGAMAYAGCFSHGGFLGVPYDPDLFNNIIQLGESPTAYVPVIEDSATGDKVAVPQMRLQTKIQSWMDRLFVSGGRIGDVYRTLFGKKSNPYFDRPDFLGVWQSSINPTNVVATSNGEADGESVNVGQMAARIDKWSDFSGRGGVDYTAKEPGTVMFITCLIPEPSYCQGLDPRLMGDSFADDFNPEMNGLGFLSVPRARYTMHHDYQGVSYNGVDPNMVAVGDSVAWDYYKTDYPRLHGEFSTHGVFSYWTLSRQFTQYYSASSVGNIVTSTELSTYVNPMAWQYLFASQSIYDPNFILMANFDMTVVNEVSSSYMPFMGR